VDIIKLTTRPRANPGKAGARAARTQGWIPAVYYGRGRETKSLEVSGHDFWKLMRDRKLSHLVDIGISGEKDSVAIIKEVQRDVLKKDGVLHVDFQHVSMDEKITVRIPVHINGVPVGVKDGGGILGHPVREILVECFPMNIPERVDVDVSELQIGDSIHVRDLSVVDAEIKDSPDEVVATVSPPVKEEEPVVEAAEGGEGEEGAEGGEGEGEQQEKEADASQEQ